MNHKMTQNNHKTTTVLLAVAVIAGLLVGTGHTAFAGAKLTKLFYPGNNKQIDTNEDQKCKTTGRSFPIIGGTVVCQLCHCHSVIRNIPFWTLV
jgi:hypothetical protein